MFDVDALGRYEAELLREEAARIADIETALQSVLYGDVVVPLVTHPEALPRLAGTRHPASVRRRVAVLVGVAAAVVVVAVLALRPSNDPDVITPADTTVDTSLTGPVVRPLDPPIVCEPELCPSLAVSPEGTLVAYDQAAKTLTWFYAEPHVVPVTADFDAEQVRLVAVGPPDVAYLLAGSAGTDAWELVAIDRSGDELRRKAVASPNVERSDRGVVERLCWSGCEPDVRVLMSWRFEQFLNDTYPRLSHTTSDVVVELGQQRWEIAWPHTLSAGSHAATRWDGGAVLSLVPEAADIPGELVELLPDGSVERFGLGDEAVYVLLPDGSAVVWRDDQLVRLSPPQPATAPAAWSPELTVQALELPIDCDGSAWAYCPYLAVSPDGTLVAYDATAETLTWYEDEPRVVTLSVELPENHQLAIGPHDIAYIISVYYVAAVAPSGAEITRQDGTNSSVYPTATGLFTTTEGSPPNREPTMPWVDLNGNPITDTRYPTAVRTDAGIEVRLGQREWVLVEEAGNRPGLSDFLDLRPRSDGGAVMVLDTFPGEPQMINLLELSPDGTIERYFVNTSHSTIVPPMIVLPDGSLIIERDLQLVRLTPPAT